MVSVLAVNNYPTEERFRRLRNCLEEAGALVTAIAWSEVSTQRLASYDGVALSGSPDMLSDDATLTKFGAEAEAVRDSPVPVLGVCFGHQLVARAFGGSVVRARRPVLRFVSTDLVTSKGRLFEGLDSPLSLLESRHEVVESLPGGFDLLAKSETTQIAAMKHRKRPIYGVQAHPERYSKANRDGKRLVANFVGSLV